MSCRILVLVLVLIAVIAMAPALAGVPVSEMAAAASAAHDGGAEPCVGCGGGADAGVCGTICVTINTPAMLAAGHLLAGERRTARDRVTDLASDGRTAPPEPGPPRAAALP